MSEKKDIVYIDSQLLILLGIDPDEGVKYIESKDVLDINPVHVKANQILKQSAVASS